MQRMRPSYRPMLGPGPENTLETISMFISKQLVAAITYKWRYPVHPVP